MNNLIIMKRLEIVIGIEQLDELMELLEMTGLQGYTVIKKASGYGSQGERNADDVLLTNENVVIILACKEDQAQKVIYELQPTMNDFGGMLLISDCHAL